MLNLINKKINDIKDYINSKKTLSEIDMSELKNKSIVDLSMILYRIKEQCNEREGEHNNDVIVYTKVINNIICDKIKELPEFYFLMDTATSFPLITKEDTILVFTEKAYANNAANTYKKYNRNVLIRTIINEEFNQFFYHMFSLSNIKGFRLNEGTCVHTIESKMLYKEDTMLSFAKNPDLVLNLYKLLQEVSWKMDYDGKEAYCKELENEMLKELKQARFVICTGKNAPLLQRGKSKKNNKTAIPLFTDELEKNMTFDHAEISFVTYDTLDKNKVYVINPKDICFELNKNIFKFVP